MTFKPFGSLLCLSVLAFCAPTAHAADTLYTNRADFLAATSGTTNIDFDGIAPANDFVTVNANSLMLSGVTFNGNSTTFVIDAGYYGAAGVSGGFLNVDYSASADTITAILPTGIQRRGR